MVDSSINDDSGRGSGRITTQLPQTLRSQEAIAYRGTGRLQNSNDPVLTHRGSGRIETRQPESNHTAYRGSGRISPVTMTLPEHA